MDKSFRLSKAYMNRHNYFTGTQSFGHNAEANYAEFDTDGTLTFHGNATIWDDLRFPASAINPVGSASPMTFDETNIGFVASASATQSIAVVVQMPHSWKIGSMIYPHIHWLPFSTNVGNVFWRLEYKWVSINAVEPAGWTTINIQTPSGGVTNKHLISAFSAVSGENEGLSSIITMKISRIGGDALDTFTGTTLLKEFDIHYEMDSLGSKQEYIK